jgi:hypothetical protein
VTQAVFLPVSFVPQAVLLPALRQLELGSLVDVTAVKLDIQNRTLDTKQRVGCAG